MKVLGGASARERSSRDAAVRVVGEQVHEHEDDDEEVVEPG